MAALFETYRTLLAEISDVATARFHDPCHAAAWADPGIDDEFQAVCELLQRGLSH